MGEDVDWIGYSSDRHGRPSDEGNDHLTAEQRAELRHQGEQRAEARGRHQAVVRIDVYDNGEAVPQLQLPEGSSINLSDQAQVNECVAVAAGALRTWR